MKEDISNLQPACPIDEIKVDHDHRKAIDIINIIDKNISMKTDTHKSSPLVSILTITVKTRG